MYVGRLHHCSIADVVSVFFLFCFKNRKDPTLKIKISATDVENVRYVAAEVNRCSPSFSAVSLLCM